MQAMRRKVEIEWFDEPEAHNYPAAQSYLSLIFSERSASAYVARLRKARMSSFKAKDVFRASGLPLLGVSNFQIEKNRRKILEGTKISPLLFVRDKRHGKVVIADGYHRLCAVYLFNEDLLIPCKIV